MKNHRRKREFYEKKSMEYGSVYFACGGQYICSTVRTGGSCCKRTREQEGWLYPAYKFKRIKNKKYMYVRIRAYKKVKRKKNMDITVRFA